LAVLRFIDHLVIPKITELAKAKTVAYLKDKVLGNLVKIATQAQGVFFK